MSHATIDAALVDAMKARLQPLGWNVYTTEHDGQAGINVHQKIQDAIGRCDLMVVLLTDDGFNSHYVMQEIGFAQHAGKLTIPIVTPKTRQLDLGMLSGLEYIIQDDAAPEISLEALASRVQRFEHARRERDVQEQRESAELARRRRQETFQNAAAAVAVIAVMLIVMSD